MAPYNRIIAYGSVRAVPLAWLEQVERCYDRWRQRGHPCPVVFHFHVRGSKQYILYPDNILMVILAEFVVAHWWEHTLHNQTALRLKAALLFRPGIVVTSVL